MSKYIVAFTDRTPNDEVEADYYTWFKDEPVTFSNRPGCEHEPTEVVARFAGHLVRSVRLEDE